MSRPALYSGLYAVCVSESVAIELHSTEVLNYKFCL